MAIGRRGRRSSPQGSKFVPRRPWKRSSAAIGPITNSEVITTESYWWLTTESESSDLTWLSLLLKHWLWLNQCLSSLIHSICFHVFGSWNFLQRGKDALILLIICNVSKSDQWVFIHWLQTCTQWNTLYDDVICKYPLSEIDGLSVGIAYHLGCYNCWVYSNYSSRAAVECEFKMRQINLVHWR